MTEVQHIMTNLPHIIWEVHNTVKSDLADTCEIRFTVLHVNFHDTLTILKVFFAQCNPATCLFRHKMALPVYVGLDRFYCKLIYLLHMMFKISHILLKGPHIIIQAPHIITKLQDTMKDVLYLLSFVHDIIIQAPYIIKEVLYEIFNPHIREPPAFHTYNV